MANRSPDPTPEIPVQHVIRRMPAIVWTVTALHVTAFLAYSILVPTYRAPDEPLHVDLAHDVSEELDYPAWDERDTGSGELLPSRHDDLVQPVQSTARDRASSSRRGGLSPPAGSGATSGGSTFTSRAPR